MGASSSRASDSGQVSDTCVAAQAPAPQTEATSRLSQADPSQQQHSQRHGPQQLTAAPAAAVTTEDAKPVTLADTPVTSTTAAAAGSDQVAEAAAAEQAPPTAVELLPSASSFNRAIEDAVIDPIDTDLDNGKAAAVEAGVPGPTTASSTTSVPVEAAGDPMKLQEQLLAAVSASQAQLHDGHQVQQGAATNPPSSAQPSHVPGSSTAAAAAAGSKDSGEGDWVVVQGAASRPPAAAGGTTAPVQVTGTEKGVMEVPISSSAGVPASGAPTAAVEGLMRGVDSYKAPEDLLQAPSSGTLVIAGRPLAAGEVPDQTVTRLSDYEEHS